MAVSAGYYRSQGWGRDYPRMQILTIEQLPPGAQVEMPPQHVTFQEAQTLATAIEKKQAPPLEWVTADGKLVARQFGELKIVRPMPVGCDGKTSGVVIIANFLAVQAPAKKMNVRLDEQTTVAFDEQAQ